MKVLGWYKLRVASVQMCGMGYGLAVQSVWLVLLLKLHPIEPVPNPHTFTTQCYLNALSTLLGTAFFLARSLTYTFFSNRCLSLGLDLVLFSLGAIVSLDLRAVSLSLARSSASSSFVLTQSEVWTTKTTI